MQNVFQVVSPISVILLGGVNAYLVWRNGGNGRPEILRKRFLFACECMDRLKGEKEVDPLVKEMGYLALAETDEVSADAIEYVLTLPSRAKSLQDYLSSYDVLVFSRDTEARLAFLSQKSSARRAFDQKVLMSLSFVLYCLPLIPVWGILFKLVSPDVGYSTAIILIFPFWFSAWIALRAFRKSVRAERLVARQG